MTNNINPDQIKKQVLSRYENLNFTITKIGDKSKNHRRGARRPRKNRVIL